MRFKDIKKMPNDELSKKHSDLKLELMKINAQVAIGTTPKNTKQIRELKRSIAKINTLKKIELQKEVNELKKEKKYKNL